MPSFASIVSVATLAFAAFAAAVPTPGNDVTNAQLDNLSTFGSPDSILAPHVPPRSLPDILADITVKVKPYCDQLTALVAVDITVDKVKHICDPIVAIFISAKAEILSYHHEDHGDKHPSFLGGKSHGDCAHLIIDLIALVLAALCAVLKLVVEAKVSIILPLLQAVACVVIELLWCILSVVDGLLIVVLTLVCKLVPLLITLKLDILL